MKRFVAILNVSKITLVILILVADRAWGQEPYQIARVIPPSPTAASLGAYGDFQVGYYNGRPDINLPLYTIKTNNLSLDIRMDYDASGTKVGQDASWVGLGWSLQAGGCISRTIRGLDDLLPGPVYNGYYAGRHLPPNTPDNGYDVNSSTPQDDLSFFEGIVGGGQDGEPDVFSYNFGAFSGKLVLGKSVDGSITYIASRNNLKVQYSNNGWVITDANGNRYYFGTVENMDNYFYNNSGSVVPIDAPLSSFTPVPNMFRNISSWYLDSIVSPTHDKISFVYSIGQSLSVVSKGEQGYYQLSQSVACADGGTGGSLNLPNTVIQYSAERQVIYDVILQKIVFRNGSVEFSTSNRDDIDPATAGIVPQKLSTITIKNQAGNVIRQENFYYTYFNGDVGTDYARLKLDSVTETGSDGTRRPPYAFTYYNPNNLPAKYSQGIDKWGYYNGQMDNQSLTPAWLVNNRSIDGGDRDADTTNIYPRNGVLSMMTYPTGGYSTFDYELNDYSHLDPNESYIQQPANVSVVAGQLGLDDLSNQQVSFDLTQQTTVDLYFNFMDNCMPSCQPNGIQGYVYAHLYKDGQGYGSWANSPGNTQDDVQLVLDPGHYTIQCDYVQYFTTAVGASWTVQIPVIQKKGAGIRIREIKSFDGFGTTKVKRFKYSDGNGVSTGRLLNKVQFDYYFTDTEVQTGNEENGAPFSCMYSGLYAALLSNALYPIGFLDGGGNVGYDLVTELDGENGENGRTEHYFYNTDVAVNDNALPAIPVAVDPENGSEVLKLTYDASGKVVAREEHSFMVNETATLKGVKLFTGPWASPNNFLLQYYDNPSNWVVPTTERDVVYSGRDSTVTSKTFYFANPDNKEMTRSTQVKSDGRTLITKYKRADDYPGAGSSSFAAQMVAAHMISPVIEQQTMVQDASSTKLISGQFMAYNQFNGFYAPSTIYRISQTTATTDTTESTISPTGQVSFHSAYEPEVYIDGYDGSGDILQEHRINGMNLTYVWDYSSTYPIAEVKNAALPDIAFTSFEADGSGGWTIGGTQRDPGSITGTMCYNLSNGVISKGGLTGSTTYIVSYWSRNGQAMTVSGTTAIVQGKTINGFTYFEHTVTGVSTVTVSGGTDIDELRLYPKSALMTTYTYTPLVGMNSACDVANRVTYFTYDPLGRLKMIQDQDGNILKTIDYHYKGQGN